MRKLGKVTTVNKILIAAILATTLAGCAGKTKLVTQAYMPDPPQVLMREPRDLNTIKQEPSEEEPE
jgi:hypothetical protein